MILSLSSNSFETVLLNQSRFIIGKGENCDIQIIDDSVSHYHAMFFINDEGLICVQDLQSINGVFVNGEKIDNIHVVCEGDNISFGDIYSYLNEAVTDSIVNIQDLDKDVKSITKEETKIYVPISSSDDEVLIDNEYCDIVFKEESFTPITSSPLEKVQYSPDEYIEADELEQAFDITNETHGKCIQVTTLVSGSIIEQFYLPIKNKTYHASGSQKRTSIAVDLLNTKEKVPFITVNDNQVEVNNLEGFEQNTSNLYLGREAFKQEAKKIPFSYFDPETLKFVTVELDIGVIKIAGSASGQRQYQDEKDPQMPAESNNPIMPEKIDSKKLVPVYKLANSYLYNSKHINIFLVLIALGILGYKVRKNYIENKSTDVDIFKEVKKVGVNYARLHSLISTLGPGSDMSSKINKSNMSDEAKKYFNEIVNMCEQDYRKTGEIKSHKLKNKYLNEFIKETSEADEDIS